MARWPGSRRSKGAWSGGIGRAGSVVWWQPFRVLASWAPARSPRPFNPSLFRSGREFAAWLGMTPRQNSSGGKERLGRTSKRGNKYIRSLLTAGAVAVLRHARNRPTRDGAWVRALLARKPTKVAAVALANKTARIVWAVMVREAGYQPHEVFRQPA